MKNLQDSLTKTGKDKRIELSEVEVARIQQEIQDFMLNLDPTKSVYDQIVQKSGVKRSSLSYIELKNLSGQLAGATTGYLRYLEKNGIQTKHEKELEDKYRKVLSGVNAKDVKAIYNMIFDMYFGKEAQAFGVRPGESGKLDLNKSDTTEDVYKKGDFIHFFPLGMPKTSGKQMYVNTSLENAAKIAVEYTRLAYGYNTKVSNDSPIDSRIKPHFSIYSTNERNDQLVFYVPDEHVLVSMGILAKIYKEHNDWFNGDCNLPFTYQISRDDGVCAVGIADEDMHPGSSYHSMLAGSIQDYLTAIKEGENPSKIPEYKELMNFIRANGFSPVCPFLMQESLDYVQQGVSYIFLPNDLKKINALPYPTLPQAHKIDSGAKKGEKVKKEPALEKPIGVLPPPKTKAVVPVEKPKGETKKAPNKRSAGQRLLDFVLGWDLNLTKADYDFAGKINNGIDRIITGKKPDKASKKEGKGIVGKTLDYILKP